jgi:hypothetical protein
VSGVVGRRWVVGVAGLAVVAAMSAGCSGGGRTEPSAADLRREAQRMTAELHRTVGVDDLAVVHCAEGGEAAYAIVERVDAEAGHIWCGPGGFLVTN